MREPAETPEAVARRLRKRAGVAPAPAAPEAADRVVVLNPMDMPSPRDATARGKVNHPQGRPKHSAKL